MICQKCGRNLPDTAKFCSGCGSTVSRPSMGYEVSPDLEPAPMLGGGYSYAERPARVSATPSHSETLGYERELDYSDYRREDGPRAQALAVLKSPIFMI